LRDLDRFRPGSGFFYLCAFVVVAALVLGGGTRSGFLSDVILQLVAVPLLLISLWRFAGLPPRSPARWVLVFCAVIALAPLLQAMPLPPSIWTKLPNRQPEAEVFELVGRGLPWMPISVSPHATVLSALSLVVPLSIFLGTILLDFKERSRLSLVILVVGLLSVFLGLSQVAQGPTSPLRFFDFSNTTEAVVFANRNHFAALLYSLTLFAAAWAVNAALATGGGAPPKRYDAATVIALVASFTVLVMLVAAQAVARSRGGLGLTIVGLLGALAIAFADRRGASGVTPAKVLAASVCLAVIFATQFALFRIMERFTADPLQDSSIPFAQTTIEAAKSFMPFGSGMGTFAPVYAMFEKPRDVLANAYVNRAHNDVLEIWLELGAVGIALMVVFIGWYAARSIAIWRQPPFGARDIDSSLARAATVVVGLLIAHSVVDYPLRTGAMMAVFAFACALLVEPPAAARRQAASEVRGARETELHRGARGWLAPEPAVSPMRTRARPSPDAWPKAERWGKNIEWPDEWRMVRRNVPSPATNDRQHIRGVAILQHDP
jgi:O-antigen ligase